MRTKLKSIYILVIAFFFNKDTLFAQGNLNVSSEISDASIDSFGFIDKKFNFIQFSDRTVGDQFTALFQKAKSQKITIAHFGDSHVQLDHFPSKTRSVLQKKYGNAGRGMCFPFSIAKTYSHTDLSSRFYGQWTTANSIQIPPKLPVGISGFVAETNDDSSSITLVFSGQAIQQKVNVRLFLHSENNNHDIELISGSKKIISNHDHLNELHREVFAFEKGEWNDTLICTFKQKGIGKLSLYGISLEHDAPGILYHNLGVGGAIYAALLQQIYFDEQIPVVQPDLFILDWGTNDIIYKNQLADSLENTIRKTILKIRKACPNTLILLTNVQDMNWKGKNVTACKTFSALIRKIASEEHCLFYDWFSVSGGKNTMSSWEKWGLGRKDNIHLTAKGYHLKGQLLSEAIENTLSKMEQGAVPYRLIVEENPIIGYQFQSDVPWTNTPDPSKQKTKKQTVQKTKSTKSYTVKNGDQLISIARKNHTTVEAIKKKNGLKTDRIKPGQRLVIP